MSGKMAKRVRRLESRMDAMERYAASWDAAEASVHNQASMDAAAERNAERRRLSLVIPVWWTSLEKEKDMSKTRNERKRDRSAWCFRIAVGIWAACIAALAVTTWVL